MYYQVRAGTDGRLLFEYDPDKRVIKIRKGKYVDIVDLEELDRDLKTKNKTYT